MLIITSMVSCYGFISDADVAVLPKDFLFIQRPNGVVLCTPNIVLYSNFM